MYLCEYLGHYWKFLICLWNILKNIKNDQLSYEVTKSMSNVINTFLFVGDKFILKMHIRYPEITYSVCGPFTKSKEC